MLIFRIHTVILKPIEKLKILGCEINYINNQKINLDYILSRKKPQCSFCVYRAYYLVRSF